MGIGVSNKNSNLTLSPSQRLLGLQLTGFFRMLVIGISLKLNFIYACFIFPFMQNPNIANFASYILWGSSYNNTEDSYNLKVDTSHTNYTNILRHLGINIDN